MEYNNYGELFYSNLAMDRPSFYSETKDDKPYRPSLREVFREFLDSINFVKDHTRVWVATGFLLHLAALFLFIVFFVFYFSLNGLFLMFLFIFYQANIFGTMWYHRYCSHHAYDFSNRYANLFFLWINPLTVREDTYVIAHHIHHFRCDRNGDPHGPHLGRIGNYLAQESYQKLNKNMSVETYMKVCDSLGHIGFPIQSYESFKRNGCIENPWHTAIRRLVAQTLYGVLFYFLGGAHLLITWLASIFLISAMHRNFNWKAHSRGVRKKYQASSQNGFCNAVDSTASGLFAAEWHETHHRHPDLANNAVLPGQVDLVFYFILFLKKIGIVRFYHERIM
jgi:stearoyl-CoA desaturase (delta-9 desaturase)